MAAVYAEPDGLRQGLVHHDITAVNLLLDPDGTRERDLATDFIATSIAATGVHVLTNKLRAGHVVRDPRESYSMLLFLDLVS